jgi:predicted DNA-binding transcriptional regulator AlpA
MGRTVDLDDILDATAVAQLIGVADARSVSTYRARDAEFPEPILVSSGGRCQYWLRQDVEAWQTKRQERGRSS